MHTNRAVKLNNGAKQSANSRLRFRAHFLKRTVGPTRVVSFRGNIPRRSACIFRGMGVGKHEDGVCASSSSQLICRHIGSNSALNGVTQVCKADIGRLYHLGNLGDASILQVKRSVHYDTNTIASTGTKASGPTTSTDMGRAIGAAITTSTTTITSVGRASSTKQRRTAPICRHIGSNSALKTVTTGCNAAISGLYRLGNVAGAAVLGLNHSLHYS